MARPSAPVTRVSSLWILLIAAGAALPAWSRILPSLDARAHRDEAARPATVPSDAELERAGARVGEIHFRTRPLFDMAGEDENTSLSRLANRLHVATRLATIEDQLLFRSGDPYRASVVAESARILRDTRYLRDAVIRPIAWHDGRVDLEVTTQDVWTFNPGVSFGRSGGKNTSGFELEDLNFLGLGTQLGVAFKSGVDRDSRAIAYRDRQLGSSWWDLSAAYSDNSDGRLAEFSLQHPFYALDSRWSAGVSLQDDERVDSRYDLGRIVDRFQTQERGASIYWGRSQGLIDGWARRLSVGVSFDQVTFADAPGEEPAALLPSDRRLVYPWVALEWVQDDFHTARNRDQIERIEDYSLGWYARVQLGLSHGAFGADRDAAMFAATVSKGFALSPRQTLQFNANTSGRAVTAGLEDSVFGAEARYYFRQGSKSLLFLNLAGELGTQLDLDHQILLGGDSGLRGYPLRYQGGDGRWLFTAEQRFFSNWYPFQLFNVGAAVFYDMGATRGRDPLGTASQGLLRDVGVGLRLGNSRSALGSVLHLDVAYPLDGAEADRHVQFVIQTKKSF